MANSKVTIVFNEMPAVNDWLRIREVSMGIDIDEQFRPLRLGPKQVKIPTFTIGGDVEDPVNLYYGFVTTNYIGSANADYNGTGLFTLTQTQGPPDSGIGTVVITANFQGAEFELVEAPDGVTVTIENQEPETVFTVTEISYSAAEANQCQKIIMSVETSVAAVKMLSPQVINDNEDNPIEIELDRGQDYIMTIEGPGGNLISEVLSTPPVLAPANFQVNVIPTPNGATANISSTNTAGLELEYSLDGDNWQESNVFPGLDQDESYTLYVRDQYGCSFSLGFTVSATGVNDPYFYISKSNPIRFARRVTWGDSANYKTDENTLSGEVDVPLPKWDVQQFQTTDRPVTQFKSNYATHTAEIMVGGLPVATLPIVKKSNFIGLKEKRDGRIYRYSSDKVGVYFQSGNVYDFDTNAVTSSHALNGMLPLWAEPGKYILWSGVWYVIENVAFDEAKNADVAIISSNYSGSDAAAVIGSIFNLHEFEVYEFEVNCGLYTTSNYQIGLRAEDPRFTPITHLSELQDVKTRQDNTVEIRYWNNDNTDVFYATGVEFLIRLEKLKESGAFPDEESDTYKTDTSVILLSAQGFEGEEFRFEPLTKEMMRKLLLALSHQNLFLDGIGYVKQGSPEVEGPLDDSNLYVVTAKLLKSGNVYGTRASGQQIYVGSTGDVPTLVDYGGGFVKY